MKYLPLRSLTGGAAVTLGVSLACLVLLLHLTTPLGSGPVGILAVFVLAYVVCASLVLIICGGLSFFLTRVGVRFLANRRLRYYVSSVIGLLPVLYLTLLSMGGASVWGVGLIVLFTGLMLFYVVRRSA